MLYEELLDSCQARFAAFFQNVPLFETQFTYTPFHAQCYQ